MLATNSAYGCRDCHPFVSDSVTSIDTIGNPGTTRSKFYPRITAKLKTLPGISSYTDPACIARMKRLRNRKTNGLSKLDLSKRKPADYMELAYREAISKLKYLLAESYAPTGMSRTKQRSVRSIYKSSNPRISESGEDTDDQSMISDSFRRKDLSRNTFLNTFPPLSKTIQSSKAYSNIALSRADLQSIPPELTSFIERQEDYIEQLERESQYCRDELINLLSKVREVVVENETLHSKNQVALSKCILQDHKDRCGNTNHECHKEDAGGHVDNTLECKREKFLEGPSIIFESRISELEAQLTQAKLELRKAQEENQVNLKRLSESGSSESNVELKAELDKALRAKYESEMKLEELQKLLSVARDKETEATQRARRSMGDRQEIEFERNQSELEIRRLKDELERQHEKLREAAQDANRRITEERQQVERRYNQQIEQLTADIANHWEATNKSQLESEKQRREINELRRELSQKQTAMDNLKKELQNKISTLQSDLNQMLSEKDAAEQEILTGKLAAERSDRQARQEQSRLQAEINSYKQRLERADADLVHCRRENLRLSEQIASLEKEISMSKMVRSEENRSETTPRLENEKELASMIMDMETKHGGIATEANDGTGAFHYNATMDSVVSPHTNGLAVGAQESQMTHQGYDTSGQQVAGEDRSEMYSNAPKRNDEMQGDLYGLSSDHTGAIQNNFVPNTMEAAEMYQQQGDARNNEVYATNDSNMETYMMEHDHNQYDEYDPSQYPEEQYVTDNQYSVMGEQSESNQANSDVARTSTETLH